MTKDKVDYECKRARALSLEAFAHPFTRHALGHYCEETIYHSLYLQLNLHYPGLAYGIF